MDKEVVVYTYSGILLSHKKDWNNAICNTWMQLEIIILKWSKSDKEREILYDTIYMWNIKYDANEPILI